LAQKEALSVASLSVGEHLCFMGSGREEEDQYLNMVVSSFLQKNTSKVSLVSGGYQAFHEYVAPWMMTEMMADHDPEKCMECASASNNNNQLLEKTNSRMKNR